MALSKRSTLSKTVLCYLLFMAPLCSITTNTICHGFILKRTPKLEAFLTRGDSTKKGLPNDHSRMNNFTKRSNAQRKNHSTVYAHGKKKGKNKEALHQVREIINKQKSSTGGEGDDEDDEEDEDDDEPDDGVKGKGTYNPHAGQQKNIQKNQKGNIAKGTSGGKNKTADLYLSNNIKIKSSLKEEEEQGDDVELERDTDSEEDALTEDDPSMEDTSPEDEDEQEEEPVTEEDLNALNKTCAEKMESVYNYIKKESYRFNLNSISNTMFENEKIKINDQIHIIKHISHIKKKENLFVITPYDPYYVNFIYNHFVKEYKELKFYVKDRSVYAVVPPLSENLKNEIRIKIKEKIEDSKGTLRNVRKQMMTKLEKVRNRIGKDIYHMQKNHIQSLHDQTRKRIEAILNDLR